MGKPPKFYQTPEFLALQKEWYGRAAETGFVDIEEGSDSEMLVETPAERNMKQTLRRHPAVALAKADYFTDCEAALGVLRFESPQDRAIWTHHARGSSVREIAVLMGISRQKVERTINRYRKRLGLTRPR